MQRVYKQRAVNPMRLAPVTTNPSNEDYVRWVGVYYRLSYIIII